MPEGQALREPQGRLRVAVLDDYQHAALESADFGSLADIADIVVCSDHIGDPGQLVLRLAGCHAVIAMRERTAFPAQVLERLADLGLIVTTGMANASIDLSAAHARGITVCGTGLGGTATQELVWALILALVRHVPAEDAAVRAGAWQVSMGRELSGSTLGLLGLGRIGSAVAGFAQAFGMDVIAWSQNLTPERAAQHGAELVTRTELFERADILSIHTRLSARTVGLVGRAELDLLGPEGLLVNTSRGPIVDEGALIEALHQRRIAGAALDVYDQEPLPVGHPLLSAPNTVLTPHIGYVSSRAYARMYSDAVECIRAWAMGAPVRVLNQEG